MEKICKIGILFLIILCMTGCKKGYMDEINYQEYHQLLDQKETFILEVMRTDCPYCQDFKPKLNKVLEDYEITIKFINLDHLSKEEEEQFLKEVGDPGTPTVIFYQEGNEKTIQSRIVGNVSIEKIISKMKASGFIEEEKTSD